MFSGALQTFYYHSKAEDTIAVKGKQADDQTDDADDEEEPDIDEEIAQWLCWPTMLGMLSIICFN